jgi:hypothetical protein
MTPRANNSNKNNNTKNTERKMMDLINEIRHPMVSSKKVAQTLHSVCRVLQARLVGEEPKLGSHEYQKYMDESACLPLTMDAILNYVMQRRHYDIIVYEWSLSALTLFSSLGSSSNQATFLVAMGAIQRTLQVLDYFPSAERLHCVGMVALSHMVANATSPSLQQAMIYGSNSSRTTTGLFLFEKLVRTMEAFPHSAPICEHACSTFGAAYVQNGHQLISRSSSRRSSIMRGEGGCAPTTTHEQQDQQVMALLFRALECVYHGLTLHSYDDAAGSDDKEATRVLRSFLRLFAGPDLTHKILHQVECQLCHGGAA